MLVKRKVCRPTEHNYQPAPSDIGIERRSVDNGTEIWLGYVCSKCSDTTQCRVAFWPKKSKTIDDKSF